MSVQSYIEIGPNPNSLHIRIAKPAHNLNRRPYNVWYFSCELANIFFPSTHTHTHTQDTQYKYTKTHIIRN